MLIKCPECGKTISDKAITCPGCGYTLRMIPELRFPAHYNEYDSFSNNSQSQDYPITGDYYNPYSGPLNTDYSGLCRNSGRACRNCCRRAGTYPNYHEGFFGCSNR